MDSDIFHDAISEDDSMINAHIESNSGNAILQNRVQTSGDTILHLVSETGHHAAVAAILLKCPLLLFKVNSEGNTALHVAARAGHTTVLSTLLDGRNPREKKNVFWLRNRKGNTAVHEAIIYNKIDAVEALLNENQPGICYSFNKQRETPLYLAANRGFHLLVDLIIETMNKGPSRSPNYEGPNGRSALHAAVICNNTGCITKLLEWDKNLVYCKDSNDHTPIHYAALSGLGNLVSRLWSVDPSIAYVGNAQGRNVLHILIENNKKDAINYLLQRSPWMIKSLITRTDDHGNTPLHLLATSECFVSGLIDHCMIDHRAVNNDGVTPLDLYYKNLTKSSVSTDDQIAIGEMLLKHAGGIWINQTPSNRVPYSQDEIRSMAKTQMIVSALIATVAFTAGLAIPGGYVSSGSPHEGMAVLSVTGGTYAFRAFVVFDFFAMLCSTTSLFMYFLITVNSRRMSEDTLNFLANEGIGLNIIGLGAIVVSFCAEISVVLHDSQFPTIHSSPGLTAVMITFIVVLISIRCVQKGGYSFFDIFQPKKWRIVRQSVTFVKYLSRRRKNV